MNDAPQGDFAAAIQNSDIPAGLARAFEGLARDRDRSLDGYLLNVEEAVPLPETKATCRCHFLAFDGNGQPMVKELIAWLVAQTLDYCIPRTRIDEARTVLEHSGSTEELMRLAAEARGLFTNLKNSGEGGEMLLYLLLEVGLGLPQLLCKMPLKTDEQMHVHGTDGIHGKVLEDGTLALYWGESKLHATVNSAIDSCLEGLAPFLRDTGGEEAKRDIYLLRDHLDLGSPELTAAVKRYFEAGTRERTQIEARGAALVGFSLEDYAFPLQPDRVTATAEVAAMLEQWRERTGLKIDQNELATFELEVFFLPFPDVAAFRAELLKELGLDDGS